MSQNQFYTLTVQSIVKTTPDCSIIQFDIPNDFKENFKYQAGQYLTLKSLIDGKEVRRSYSLCSSPMDKEWKVGIKQIEGGLYSTFANHHLKVGDTVEVMPPNGHFTIDVDPAQSRNYVAFAAGSGITPILSIIKTQLTAEPLSTFKLFYGNKSVSSIILKEELEALKNIFMERFEIFYFLTKEKRNIPFLNGRINQEKLDIIFNDITNVEDVNHVFSCGPESMILLIKDYLLEKGMKKEQIHFELFTTDGQKHNEAKATLKKKFEGKTSNITILEGGKSFEFIMEQGSNNILDEALVNNADLPFACKGGVCATCKCKLVEGDVNMLLSYGLEDDEVEAGYILSCQSIPTSQSVIVDFDI